LGPDGPDCFQKTGTGPGQVEFVLDRTGDRAADPAGMTGKTTLAF